MRVEQHYKWRIQWNGKWTTTRYHCSEESIRIENPEAIRVEGTLIEREIPETAAEMFEREKELSTGGMCQRPPYQAPFKLDPNDVPF